MDKLEQGSTGIQAVPVIAETAKHFTVFQRTPNYSVPARNKPLSKDFKKYVKENFNELRKTVKKTPNGHAFLISETLVHEVDEKERLKRYENAWEKGGFNSGGHLKILLVINVLTTQPLNL